MAANLPRQLLLWLTLNVCIGAGEVMTLFSGETDNVSLPCGNVNDTHCSTASWYHSTNSDGVTSIELVSNGKIRDPHKGQRAGRLEMGSNCSLQIGSLSSTDAGEYTCQPSPDSSEEYQVLLFILSISQSPPNKKTGNTVTLNCSLNTCPKNAHGRYEIQMLVDGYEQQDLQTRYQMMSSDCYLSLTLPLNQSENNRTWTCQVSEGGQVKMSVSHTTSLSGASKTDIELAIRLTIFFLILALSVIIGAVIYVKKRKCAIGAEQEHTVAESNDYVDMEVVCKATQPTHSSQDHCEKNVG